MTTLHLYTNSRQEQFEIAIAENGSIRVVKTKDKSSVMYAQKGWTLEQTKKFLDM